MDILQCYPTSKISAMSIYLLHLVLFILLPQHCPGKDPCILYTISMYGLMLSVMCIHLKNGNVMSDIFVVTFYLDGKSSRG